MHKEHPHPARGVLAGLVGGLTASWVMNRFIAGPGQTMQEALKSDEERRREQNAPPQDGEDATMKAADAIVHQVTGGRHLSHEEKERDGPIVHYGFGTLMGGVYGGLAEYSSLARAGYGALFGTALWAGADLVGVPAFGFAAPPDTEPASAHATHWAAHIVYAVTTDLARRAIRAWLGWLPHRAV